MRKLQPEQVAEIRAAQDVYRAGDVAKAYSVDKKTVFRIWDYTIHKSIDAAEEPPSITTRKYVKDYVDDIAILRERGMSFEEIAEHIGMSRSAVYAARGLFL